MTDSGQVIQFSRLDTSLSKADLMQYMQQEHSQVPVHERMTKDTIIALHRLIHLGLGR